MTAKENNKDAAPESTENQNAEFTFHHDPSKVDYHITKEGEELDDVYNEDFLGTWGLCVPGYESVFLLTNCPMLLVSWLVAMTGHLVLAAAFFLACIMSFTFHLHQAIDPPSSRRTAFWLKMDIGFSAVAGTLLILGALANGLLPDLTTMALQAVAMYCGSPTN